MSRYARATHNSKSRSSGRDFRSNHEKSPSHVPAIPRIPGKSRTRPAKVSLDSCPLASIRGFFPNFLTCRPLRSFPFTLSLPIQRFNISTIPPFGCASGALCPPWFILNPAITETCAIFHSPSCSSFPSVEPFRKCVKPTHTLTLCTASLDPFKPSRKPALYRGFLLCTAKRKIFRTPPLRHFCLTASRYLGKPPLFTNQPKSALEEAVNQ